MEGRSETAIAAARKVAARVTDESMDQLPLLAGFRVVPYYALTRFGRWDEMLTEPEPADRYVVHEGHLALRPRARFRGQGAARRGRRRSSTR